jgi:hypothetical protein
VATVAAALDVALDAEILGLLQVAEAERLRAWVEKHKAEEDKKKSGG